MATVNRESSKEELVAAHAAAQADVDEKQAAYKANPTPETRAAVNSALNQQEDIEVLSSPYYDSTTEGKPGYPPADLAVPEKTPTPEQLAASEKKYEDVSTPGPIKQTELTPEATTPVPPPAAVEVKPLEAPSVKNEPLPPNVSKGKVIPASAETQTPPPPQQTETPPFGNDDNVGEKDRRDGIDRRIRVIPRDKSLLGTYGGILSPLVETDGLLFPFTPKISMSNKANYSDVDLLHTNAGYHMFKNSSVEAFTIAGTFTAQSAHESKYLLAAIHFGRTFTKMHFGTSDAAAGLPPPVLLVSGYGKLMFNELPVVLSSFSMNFDDSVDYVKVDNTDAWVPIKCELSYAFTVQQTPAQWRDEFDLNKFASGELMRNGGWW